MIEQKKELIVNPRLEIDRGVEKLFKGPLNGTRLSIAMIDRLDVLVAKGVKTVGLSLDMGADRLPMVNDMLSSVRRSFGDMELRVVSRVKGDLSTQRQQREFAEAVLRADVIGANLGHAPNRERAYIERVLAVADQVAERTGKAKPLQFVLDTRMPQRNGLEVLGRVLKDRDVGAPVSIYGLRTVAMFAPTWRNILFNIADRRGFIVILDPASTPVFNNGWECSQDHAFREMVSKGIKVALGGVGHHGLQSWQLPRLEGLSDEQKRCILITNGLEALGVPEAAHLSWRLRSLKGNKVESQSMHDVAAG